MASLLHLVYKLKMTKLPFDKGSVIFAPMEGVTEGPYRIAVSRAFPEWDYYSSDFYRVPSVGAIYEENLLDHYGRKALGMKGLKSKTSYQILASTRSQITTAVEKIAALDFNHLDLNIGCPSKKVNSHYGGAFLLSDLVSLREIIKNIRKTFPHIFTAKIRVGYKDDKDFFNILKMLEDEGVDAITIHARTRDQLYQGVADWKYIKEAVKVCKVPIIGNGDIWTVEDIIRIFDECDPYAVMIGRGALKTPWLATLYQQYKNNPSFLSPEFLLHERKKGIDTYFHELEKELRIENTIDQNIHKRFKSLSRYIFDDYENFEVVRGEFLRSESLDEFKKLLIKYTK